MTMIKRIEIKIKRFLNVITKFILTQPTIEPSSNYDRILIIRPGGLGDMILTIPILESIRKRNPNSLIDVLCEEKNSIPLKGLNIIDNIYIFSKSPISLFKLLISLNGFKYQYVLNLNAYPSFTFGFLSRIIAPNAVRASGDQREYSFFYNRIIDIPPKNQQHMIERLFMLASDICLVKNNYSMKPWFDYGPNINKKAESIFNALVTRLIIKHNNPRIILINLSAGLKRREWSVEKYIEFLTLVTNKYNHFIDGWVVLTNPREMNKSKFLIKQLNNSKIIEIPVITDFRIIITLLKSFYLLITPDTSLVHAASGIGSPVFDLILRENLVTWSPIGTKNKVVSPHKSQDICTLEVEKVLSNFEYFLEELEISNM